MLSVRKTILTMAECASAKKNLNGEYQPDTSIFWFNPQVTYPDGIAQCNKLVHEYLARIHLWGFRFCFELILI
jgi:hypothetical protein